MAESATGEAATETEESEETPLEVYEWGGGIVAGLGFFMTPILTGLPALYCALKVQEEKPLASAGILAVVLATILFWAGFVFGEQVLEVVTTDLSTSAGALLVFAVAVFIIPIVAFVGLLILRR